MTSIDKGHACADVTDFVEMLRWWYEKTDEPTIGDVGTYGGSAWVHVPIGGVPCHLNADTRREGIGVFLEVIDKEGTRFAVIANQNGKTVNRVVPGEAKEPVKYLYLYTDKVQDRPAVL